MGNTAQEEKKPQPLNAAAVVADLKQIETRQPNEKPNYQGILLFDWDETIVDDMSRFINEAKIFLLLNLALKNRIDVHIVTARPSILTTFNSLLEKINKLGLLDETHNKNFWLARIHCVVTETEYQKLKRDIPSQISVAYKKKEVVDKILALPEYNHLQKSQIYFYDDNQYNCGFVGIAGKVTVVHAKANGSHLDNYPNTIQISQELIDKQNLQNYLRKLNACLNAMYPDRMTWGDKPKTNAGGVKEIHKILLKHAANPSSFDLQGVTEIYNVVTHRLQTLWAECFTFLGGREPLVQHLYLALDYYPRLDSMEFPNRRLDDLLLRVQARNAELKATATVAAPTPATPLRLTAH